MFLVFLPGSGTRSGSEVGGGVPTNADRRWGRRRPPGSPTWLPFLLLACAGCVLRAAEPTPGAPARNWVLPLFTDKEGFRSMTLRGSEARTVGDDRIEVVDLSITVFSGDATAHVDTMMLSPQASFFQADKQARGAQSVRVIRDDLEAVGTTWVYDHAQKRVSLDGGVRIVFQAELKDLLK